VLYRDYWLVLDAQTEPQPVQRALLERVKDFTIRYLNDGQQWQETWPPAQPSLSTSPASSGQDMRYLRWRPRAVEVTLELEDWGTITRIIEVTG
jgi:type II secretion system protein J